MWLRQAGLVAAGEMPCVNGLNSCLISKLFYLNDLPIPFRTSNPLLRPVHMPYIPVPMPHREGSMPYREGSVPYREGSMPYREVSMPHREGPMPHREGAVPYREGPMTRRDGPVPHREDLIPYRKARPAHQRDKIVVRMPVGQADCKCLILRAAHYSRLVSACRGRIFAGLLGIRLSINAFVDST